MENLKNWGKMFLKNISPTFASSILTISIVSWLSGDHVMDFGGPFALGRQGMTYGCIGQLFVISVILSGFSTLLMTDLIFKKAMLLWRAIALLFLTWVTVGSFIVVFGWFPLDMWMAWISFAVSTTALLIGGAAVLILATKLQNRQYGRQLFNYKAKQNQEGGGAYDSDE